MLNREQVMVLTGWNEATLRRMLGKRKLYEYDGYFCPVELYKASPRAREALEQLLAFHTTGSWWLKFHRWQDLEAAGLIRIEKPRHPVTGYEYDRAWWWVVHTPLGCEVAEELEDAIEYHCLRQEVRGK